MSDFFQMSLLRVFLTIALMMSILASVYCGVISANKCPDNKVPGNVQAICLPKDATLEQIKEALRKTASS